jgi:hypothetical protein
VPRSHAADILALARGLLLKEEQRVAEIEAGARFKPEIDDALRTKGVID